MRSAIFDRFGPAPEVLTIGERPLPEPGPGQVRIKLSLSPIHNHDLMTIAGKYGVKPALPAVPGTEAVGVVDALGEGVSNLRVGQRVAGGNGQMWADYYLGDTAWVIPMPDTIADETAAQLVSMPLSALMLLHHIGIKPGEWLIQNTANGLVGKLVARFGREKGIHVIGLVRRDAAVKEMAEIGIERVVSTENENWRDTVKDLTGGAPILYGTDSVGGQASADIASVMAENSKLYSFGAMSGKPMYLPADSLLFKNMSAHGFWLYKLLQSADKAVVGAMVGELITKAASGQLVLPVGGVFGLDDVAKAAAASDEPGRRGKVMVRG